MHDEFGGPLQARRGELIDVLALDFVAERGGQPVGLMTYGLDAPLEAVTARERICLVITNDKLEALRLSQRRVFRLSALRAGAIDEAREELKPQVSAVGEFASRYAMSLSLTAVHELREPKNECPRHSAPPHPPRLRLWEGSTAAKTQEALREAATKSSKRSP